MSGKSRKGAQRRDRSSASETPGEASGQHPPASAAAVRNLQRRIRVDGPALRSFLQALITEVAPDAGAMSLVLVGDERMRVLNHRYRGYDRATDVLSFPAETGVDDERYLGDVVVSVDTAARQAARRRSGLEREIRLLALHGLLHLLGYDHQTDHGEMRRLEYRLRRKHGLIRPRKARK